MPLVLARPCSMTRSMRPSLMASLTPACSNGFAPDSPTRYHFHGSADRRAQYASGSSASGASSAAAASSHATPRASSSSELGDRRRAAEHDAGPRLGERRGERDRILASRRALGGLGDGAGARRASVSRPLASASLTMTSSPAAWASASASPGGALEQVPRRLDARRTPPTATRARDRRRPGAGRSRSARCASPLARSRASSSSTAASSSTPLSSVAEWIWYSREPIAQQRAALRAAGARSMRQRWSLTSCARRRPASRRCSGSPTSSRR